MVGRTPNPPRAVRLPVPRSPGGHNTPGAVQGPGRGCATRRGGVTPYPPPAPGRGFCNAVGVVLHGAHRSPGPLQWQHRAGPLLAGSEGPRRAGLPRSAPLRPALRDRASLPARPAAASQVLGNAARTLEPLALPRPYSWPRGARRGSVGPGQVCGERGIEKPRVRPGCGLSGSVCPHPGCGPASLRCHRGTGAGEIGFCVFGCPIFRSKAKLQHI